VPLNGDSDTKARGEALASALIGTQRSEM
jgi:hypothetical protein